MPRRWTWALALMLLAPGCGEHKPAGHRLIEPRISGGVADTPCRVVSDGPVGTPRCAQLTALSPEEAGQLYKDKRVAENEADRDPRPDLLQRLSLLTLLSDWIDPSSQEKQRGAGGRLDGSVHLLEDAAARAPEDARILSDLSASFYVRAQSGGSPEDYLRALDAAEKAVAADGSLPHAAFNRALAFQALYLPLEAWNTWDDYLRLDPDSVWAAEAEARREALRGWTDPGSWEVWKPLLDKAVAQGNPLEVARIVARFRQPAREQAERVLLPDWAGARLAGRFADADRSLRIARATGTALAEVNGDRMVLEAVAAIDTLVKREDEAGLDVLAHAHVDYSDGFQLYKHQKAEEGTVRLAAARDGFQRARSPFEAKAELYLAGCDYHGGRFEETLEALARLRHDWQRRPYPSLFGEAAWMESAARGVLGDMAGAARSYRAALADFEQLGEPESVATLDGLLAEVLEQLGLRREAWQYRYRALSSIPQVRDPAYRASTYQKLADVALKEGYPKIALRFWNEVVHQARLSGNDLLLVDALCWRGLLKAQLDDGDGVEKDFARARERLKLRGEDVSRHRSEAMLDLVEGELRIERDAAGAVRLLTSALERFAELGHHPLALVAYRTRAEAWRRAGNLRKAEADLASALRVYDRFGRAIQAEEERLAFLGVTEGVFDELISLQAVDLGAPARAFDSADRSRTRVLPVHLAGVQGRDERQKLLQAEPEPLGLEEVQRQLPPGTVLVQYSVLPDRLLVWVVRREGWSFLQKAGSEADLRTRVKRLRSFGRQEWDEDSSQLYDLLLRPWIGGVGEGETLVVIPDKTLHSVPFAALRNRDSGRYLVEEHRLAVSPSATLYVRALGREHPLSRPPRVLAVGNPAFDRGLFPLPSLPGAEAEARAVAALHPGSSDLLTGADATSREFLSRVRQYEWIHFAGHAMVNLQNPLLSMLVLAPSGTGDTGAVTAREIYSMDLGATRMVVLSACETGAYDPDGEGASALARAFLAAGVPTVVASLWKVDDQPTSRLFQAFHRSLRAGSDPVSALREAQIGLLRESEEDFGSPEAWAAFEVIGASAH